MWYKAILALVFLLGAAETAAAQLPAERFFRRGNIALTITAGGAAFSAFQRAVETPDTGGGRFDRRLSAGTTGAFGAELIWWAGRAWGLRAHASYMPSRFAVRRDREGEEWLRTQGAGARQQSYARLRIWAADVSALVRPPFNLGRAAPYGIIGAGLVSYRPQSARALPPEAEAAFTGGARTTPAVVGGVGALLPLQKGNMLLSLAVTDHITRTPVAEAGAAAGWRDQQNRSSLSPSEGGDAVGLTSSVRLMLGLTIPLRSH